MNIKYVIIGSFSSLVLIISIYSCSFLYLRSALTSGKFGQSTANLYATIFYPLRYIFTYSEAHRGYITVICWYLSDENNGNYAYETMKYNRVVVPSVLVPEGFDLATESRSVKVKSSLIIPRIKICGVDGI